MPASKAQRRLIVGISLDRSSSMAAIINEIISATNEQFETLRKSDDAANTYVMMNSFNHEVTPVFKDADGKMALVPVSQLANLTKADYIPSGMTAMRDGVGDIIDAVTREAHPVDDVMIVVISDGEENTSTRVKPEDLQSKVKETQDAGWNYAYIGANQDLAKIKADFGFHAGNMLSFNASAAGTKGMSHVHTNALASYTLQRSAAIKSGLDGRYTTQSLYAPADVGGSVVDVPDASIDDVFNTTLDDVIKLAVSNDASSGNTSAK